MICNWGRGRDCFFGGGGGVALEKKSIAWKLKLVFTLMMTDQVQDVVVYLLVVQKFVHDLLWTIPNQQIDPYRPFFQNWGFFLCLSDSIESRWFARLISVFLSFLSFWSLPCILYKANFNFFYVLFSTLFLNNCSELCLYESPKLCVYSKIFVSFCGTNGLNYYQLCVKLFVFMLIDITVVCTWLMWMEIWFRLDVFFFFLSFALSIPVDIFWVPNQWIWIGMLCFSLSTWFVFN